MSGIEFLKTLLAAAVFRYLPTIILTPSQNRTHLLERYKTGIAGYLIKPLKRWFRLWLQPSMKDEVEIVGKLVRIASHYGR
jgi:CheY-like chemotaxis protein